jgi:hypothetical protein
LLVDLEGKLGRAPGPDIITAEKEKAKNLRRREEHSSGKDNILMTWREGRRRGRAADINIMADQRTGGERLWPPSPPKSHNADSVMGFRSVPAAAERLSKPISPTSPSITTPPFDGVDPRRSAGGHCSGRAASTTDGVWWRWAMPGAGGWVGRADGRARQAKKRPQGRH